MGHVAEWWLLDDIERFKFIKFGMGNFEAIAGIPVPVGLGLSLPIKQVFQLD